MECRSICCQNAKVFAIKALFEVEVIKSFLIRTYEFQGLLFGETPKEIILDPPTFSPLRYVR